MIILGFKTRRYLIIDEIDVLKELRVKGGSSMESLSYLIIFVLIHSEETLYSVSHVNVNDTRCTYCVQYFKVDNIYLSFHTLYWINYHSNCSFW